MEELPNVCEAVGVRGRPGVPPDGEVRLFEPRPIIDLPCGDSSDATEPGNSARLIGVWVARVLALVVLVCMVGDGSRVIGGRVYRPDPREEPDGAVAPAAVDAAEAPPVFEPSTPTPPFTSVLANESVREKLARGMCIVTALVGRLRLACT